MPIIPPGAQVAHPDGFKPLHEGKVHNTYELPNYPGLRLSITTPRLSSFDVILPCLVPGKGIYLNLIDIWWRMQLSSRMPFLEQDLVAWGEGIDDYLPLQNRGDSTLWMNAKVIRSVDMILAELIWRGIVIGSLASALETGEPYCGHVLPAGLKKLDPLNPPLFTPTTKAAEGHDEQMTVAQFIDATGQPLADSAINTTRQLFITAREIAEEKGLIILDTKFEGGKDQEGGFLLADEVLTPDSSRYATAGAIERARSSGQNPVSYDKQPIRDWMARTLEVKPTTKLTEAVIAKVHAADIPNEIITETSDRYHRLFTLLTGFADADSFVKNKGILPKAT